MEFEENADHHSTALRKKIDELSKAQTQHSIYRVHKLLRDINRKAYEPDIISIGPYHHDKDIYKMMEEHKLRYLESLLRRKNQDLETYISAMKAMGQEARNCYAEPIKPNAANLNADEFTDILVLDGCFIIELVRKYESTDSSCLNDPLFQMDWIKSSLQRDLMLFENQVPFFVLRKLFDLIEGPNQHITLVRRLLKFFLSLYPAAVSVSSYWTDGNLEEVKHLLDLIHSNWRLSLSSSNDICINIDDLPLEKNSPGKNSPVIPTATDLTNANLKFKKKEDGALFDIEFRNGTLLIPPLIINDKTECFFRNLIAYEQYFPNHQPTFVTDYVWLMDLLINYWRDVEVLSRRQVIVSRLGDHKVVADIFNRLRDSVVLSDTHFIYTDTFAHINAHYKKCWNRAMAALKRDYLNSPWGYISLFAALVLLLLTAAQTVFSALQLF